jgi:UDP-glucose 4-epimerase
MNVAWITGAHGFLGRHVAKCFAENNYSVAGLDLEPWSPKEAGQWGLEVWAQGDVAGEYLDALMDRTGPPKVVFHAAGSGSVGHSFYHPLEDFERNVSSTARLLEFLRQRAPEAYFILPSSAAVYGVQPPGPISEEVASSPASPYGIHKLMAELLCSSTVDHFGLPCAVIRYFSLYGPELRKQLLWDLAGRVMAQPHEVILFGTGDETRDMLYVEDAARLVFLLAQRQQPGLTLVNGGTGVASSVREIASTLLEQMEKNVKLHFSQEVRSGDPAHYQADIAKARGLGFEPRWSLQEGLAAYADWLANEGQTSRTTGRFSNMGVS